MFCSYALGRRRYQAFYWAFLFDSRFEGNSFFPRYLAMILKDVYDIFTHTKKGYHERQFFQPYFGYKLCYAILEGDQMDDKAWSITDEHSNERAAGKVRTLYLRVLPLGLPYSKYV